MARKKITPNPDAIKMEEASKPMPSPIPSPIPMLNTITLSADMSTIYLIESGRVIPYSLYSIGGVLIGLVGGQITVVSALDPQPDAGSEASVLTRSASIPVVKSAKISTDKGQWTLLFLPKQSRISIIGATDIDVSIREGEGETMLEGYIFDLRESYVNIRRSGNVIVAVALPIKG